MDTCDRNCCEIQGKGILLILLFYYCLHKMHCTLLGHCSNNNLRKKKKNKQKKEFFFRYFTLNIYHTTLCVCFFFTLHLFTFLLSFCEIRFFRAVRFSNNIFVIILFFVMNNKNFAFLYRSHPSIPLTRDFFYRKNERLITFYK